MAARGCNESESTGHSKYHDTFERPHAAYSSSTSRAGFNLTAPRIGQDLSWPHSALALVHLQRRCVAKRCNTAASKQQDESPGPWEPGL